MSLIVKDVGSCTLQVFVRELVSNASDALEKLRHMQLTDKDYSDKYLGLEIHISTDDKNKTITIQVMRLLASFFLSFVSLNYKSTVHSCNLEHHITYPYRFAFVGLWCGYEKRRIDKEFGHHCPFRHSGILEAAQPEQRGCPEHYRSVWCWLLLCLHGRPQSQSVFSLC